MIKKLFRLFCAMLMVGLLVNTYALAASATDYSGPKPLTPQLSSDGKTLYNGVPTVVLIADPNPPANQVNIPPPAKLSTLPEKVSSTFNITYVPNGGTDSWGERCYAFPAGAQTAFAAAAAIWGNLLASNVPIAIRACWANLGASTTLGYAGGQTSYRDFAVAPRANIWYQSSLTNALRGVDSDSALFDMHITYNSNFSWYYGTDGATPAGQYDLMSVVLHEIAHGLNFSGSMISVDGITGAATWGMGSPVYPNIYDYYMRDNSGNQLINTAVYANGSAALGSAVRSDSIWFHGTNAIAANGGTRVKMYAPAAWAGGSSYSHLNYATFSGGANRLMVYATSIGVATHDPGPVTKGLLKDLGWTVSGGAVPAAPSGLSASTVSATAINLSWTDNSTNETGFKVEMKTGAGGSYSQLGTVSAGATGANITGLTEGTTYYYRVRAYNADGDSAYSNEANAITLPAAPSGLSASSASATSINLNWTVNSSSETGFKVEMKTGAGGSYSQLVPTVSAGATGATVTGLTTGTTYYYRVRAYIGALNSDYSNEANATPVVPSAGGGGGGGGCFIATAAFGTPMEKHVQILRDFRDSFLLTSSAGQAFVKFYYEVSPPIAGKIAQSEGLRFITRGSLMPFVGMAYLMVTYGVTTTLLLALSLMLMLGAVVWIIRRKMMMVNP
ncbi:MAG: CFI-box-CTERM domain-containing protein [Smithellaceae bacterium]|nr:CFI-box-CTERM domain-containing protein [Smithellaceae bacterium]